MEAIIRPAGTSCRTLGTSVGAGSEPAQRDITSLPDGAAPLEPAAARAPVTLNRDPGLRYPSTELYEEAI